MARRQYTREFKLEAVKLIRERGVTVAQENLAFESGIHRTYISGVERGARNPTVLVLKELADALGALPGDLLQPIASRRRP